MSGNIAVSVIVPVYNGERYLEESLISLAKQTLENIEIICINNASTDSSLNILLAFKEVFPDRFVIINSKTNGGPGGGRNIGISHAKGEYIGFMDQDDHVNKDMYKLLYEEAKRDDYDIVRCNYYNKEFEKNIVLHPIKGSLQNSNIRYTYITETFFIWNRIYKRELVDAMSMPLRENCIDDDTDFNVEAGLRAEKISHLNDALYFFNFTGESGSHSNKISINKLYNDCESCLDAIKKRISVSPNKEVGNSVYGYVVLAHLQTILFFTWTDPNFSYETFTRFYDYAQSLIQNFYAAKFNKQFTFKDLLWNSLCEGKPECYNSLLNFRKKVESGELDAEIAQQNKNQRGV